MFYYVSGTVAEIGPNLAVIDCGGVGYACATTNYTISRLKKGERAKLFTYLHVREEIFELFGFSSQQELSSFKMLIGVSGVGPKAALAILSSTTPNNLALSIVTGDEKALTAAPGIGKKIAQRIILELKDKLAKEQTSFSSDGPVPAIAAGGANKAGEASAALAVLGYGTPEIAAALNEELSAQWRDRRGLEIVAFGVSSVKADEADEQMIKDMQRDAAYMDPTRAAAMLSRSQGDAMKAAASNTATGPAMAFMGMGMAGQVGGVNAQDLYAMGRQQAAQQPAAPVAGSWTCACGQTGNTGKFCGNCGRPRPAAPEGWTCVCDAVNKGKFCSECGRPKPAGTPKYKCDKCGWEPDDPTHPPKFCPECGDPFDDGDIQS